jgi:hypothetical protein
MPRRRKPVVPARATLAARVAYDPSGQLPKRGLPTSLIWPDTGILLFAGTQAGLPELIKQLYGRRMRILRRVENELRGLSYGSSNPDATQAASRAVQAFFVDGSPVVVDVSGEDTALLDTLIRQLNAAPGGAGNRHTGEANIIARAVREAQGSQAVQVMLTNDHGAAVVAEQNGLIVRHSAHVLAEMACMDKAVTPDWCLRVFRESCSTTSPPQRNWPSDSDAFSCSRVGSNCEPCDAMQARFA